MSETWDLHSPRDQCLAAPRIIYSSLSLDVTHMGPCNQTLARKITVSISMVPSQKFQQRGSMKQKKKNNNISSRDCDSPGNSSVPATIREWLHDELPLSRRKVQPEAQASWGGTGMLSVSCCPCWIPAYTSGVWPQPAVSLPTPALLALSLCLAFHYPRSLLTRSLHSAVRSWWLAPAGQSCQWLSGAPDILKIKIMGEKKSQTTLWSCSSAFFGMQKSFSLPTAPGSVWPSFLCTYVPECF